MNIIVLIDNRSELTWKFLQRSSNEDDSLIVVAVDWFLFIIKVINVVVSFENIAVLFIVIVRMIYLIIVIKIFKNQNLLKTMAGHKKYVCVWHSWISPNNNRTIYLQVKIEEKNEDDEEEEEKNENKQNQERRRSLRVAWDKSRSIYTCYLSKSYCRWR
jgi:hypothetical protein